MPLDGRDYIRGNHPSTCTCVDCCEKRLKQLKNEVHPDYVSYCPKCGQKSLWHNVREQKYECLNLKCKFVGSSPEERKTSDNVDKISENHAKRFVKSPIPKWLVALLLIFTFSIIGLIINALVGNVIPFCILFGFSVIFSFEKWFNYYTIKQKWRNRKIFEAIERWRPVPGL